MAVIDHRLLDLKSEVAVEMDRLLAWWSDIMWDKGRGGFYGRVDGEGILDPEADRSVILNTRILWTFVSAFSQTGKSTYLRLAHVAFDYIIKHFWDEEDGGVFWMVNADGEVVDSEKQVYAQAAAIYAFSEYFAVTKNNAARDKALHLYHLIERHSRDRKFGGYHNTFNAEWMPEKSRKLTNKDTDPAKIMRTHLLILEAYNNLYRAFPHKDYEGALRNILKVYLNRFCGDLDGHVSLYYDEQWNVLSKEISFGHDMQSSWLIWDAANRLKDSDLISQAHSIMLTLVDSCLKAGLSDAGSVFDKADGRGIAKHKGMHWWTQAESMIAFLSAYQVMDDEKYLQHVLSIWNFIKEHFIDNGTGEWHSLLNADGLPVLSSDKAGAWKSPLHHVRMCLLILKYN